MKIETTKVEKIKISEIDRLDPVTAILEDFGPGRGKIIIECYGKSWSSSWGGMGKDTKICQFFCSCDEHYLAGNLSSINSAVIDIDKITEHARVQIIASRKTGDISAVDARDLYDDVEWIEEPLDYELMHKIYGDEWWHSLPDKINPDYEYLCRIILAVKAALKTTLLKAA
ncbi:MAG: hypothetical protein GQ578_09280 [Desulfuromonadaceae bacterium]|nr:hypothetical protein [Desulfuromonadaceae bacterium]